MKIHDRPKAGPGTGLLLAVLFAGVMLPIATFDLWTTEPVDKAGHAVFTVRLPETGIYRDTLVGTRFEHRRVVVGRGDPIDSSDRRLLEAYESGRRPPSAGLLIGLGITYFLLALMFTSYLRKYGYRGALLRTQLVLLFSLVVLAGAARAFFLLTPYSSYLIPLGALSIAVAVHHDRQVAFAATVAGALLVGSLIPFDLGLALVLLIQGFGAVIVLGRPRRPASLILAGFGSGGLAALSYVALYFLVRGQLPEEDLSSLVTSGLLGAFAGGVGAGLLATIVSPILQRTLGQVPRSQLVELTDLNHPMLKKIAQDAPGTWAHSLAMANMAELAATAIGANALLVRVGAYFHDLGKSVRPQYYIENLQAGEPSPHDNLDPDVSADAIFSHCTEGVRLGRQAGIPERVLDFMHMHHGNGLLEYFWHKNQEQGNPKGLTERHFRYPGIPPQTKETGILAICDAVEAASRTLRNPQERDLSNLVQRIVFGKLRLGQLDDAGLTSADLKALCNSLVDTLKNSFHVRIEYPWQKEERTRAASAATEIQNVPIAATANESSRNISHLILIDARLDSADAPRPPETSRVAQAQEPARALPGAAPPKTSG